jgi:hypothetical protein
MSNRMPDRLASSRLYLGVFVLNALLAFPVAYQSYKQYDVHVASWDVREYMDIAKDGPGGSIPPFRFRALTSLTVAALRPLPGYDVDVDFTKDPVDKKDFFHFVALTGLLTILTSTLLFVHLRDKVGSAYAWMGSVLYLFSFYTVACGFIPMADAACHLAILSGVMAFERKKPWWLALTCLVGAFAKETSVIVLIVWIAAHGLRDRRKTAYLLAVAPAVAVYVAAYKLSPGPLEYNYYRPAFMIGNVLSMFHPSNYGRTGFFNVILAQLPFLVAGMAWLGMRFRKGGEALRGRFSDPGLLLIPFLLWLGMTMDLFNNTGRFIFMAFPALILFEVRVAREIATRLGIERPER